jgi:hypothetical protein
MRVQRFGVSDGQRFSQYWKVSATARRPELVVSGNRSGNFLHLTAHENEAFWHIKIPLPDRVIERPWQPPREVVRGVRRLVRLLIPIHAVRYPPPPRAGRVTWYPAPASERNWVEFTVLHCARGIPEIRSAHVLGTATLADGTIAVVMGRDSPAEPGSFTFHPPDPDRDRDLLRQPTVGALVHGISDDGCLWFVDLHASPRGPDD